MEAFLHLVWAQQLGRLEVVEGSGIHELEVIDVGEYNHDAGPDFFNAKVKIDGLLWAGAVEIHGRAHEWTTHGHDTDPAYASVILHVVEEADAPTLHASSGRTIPMARIVVPEELRARADYLVRHATSLACAPLTDRIEPSLIVDELESLFAERMMAKARAIHALWEQTQDWYEALYITLVRSFGFGLNGDAMVRLARSLPLRCIRKQSDRPEQIEAMLLGQAGLLGEVAEGDFRLLLEREYSFLSRKYELTPLTNVVWRWARTRPANFPLRRLIQLSSVLRNPQLSVDSWVRAESIAAIEQTLSEEPPSLFWQEEARRARTTSLALSRSTKQVIILNAVLPLKIAWAMVHGHMDEAMARVQALAQGLPPEDNRHIRLFAQAGLRARHAADGQALVGRYQHYCSERKCIYCVWGRALLTR